MTDQLERLFADLRAETMAEVRPPGVAAARRTVRRRRLTATAVGAAALVAVAGLTLGLPNRPGSSVAAEPTAAPGVLNDRGQLAAQRVGQDHTAGPGAVLALHNAAELTMIQFVADATYTFRVACVGPGTVTVTANDTVLSVRCLAADAQSTVIGTEVSGSSGKITVRATPDAAAAGRSAVAYQLQLTDAERWRLAEEARQALAPGDGISSSVLVGKGGSEQHAAPTPGRYRVDFSCVGVGLMRVSVQVVGDDGRVLGSALAGREFACSATAKVGSATVSVPRLKGARSLVVWLSPDETASGQVGAAARLVKT